MTRIAFLKLDKESESIVVARRPRDAFADGDLPGALEALLASDPATYWDLPGGRMGTRPIRSPIRSAIRRSGIARRTDVAPLGSARRTDGDPPDPIADPIGNPSIRDCSADGCGPTGICQADGWGPARSDRRSDRQSVDQGSLGGRMWPHFFQSIKTRRNIYPDVRCLTALDSS